MEVFHDGCHTDTILELLNSQRTEGLFCDVTIVAGDVRIRAHRCILAACSPYFKLMFTVGLSETHDEEVHIPAEPDSLKELISFAYSSSINITQDNVQSLLSLANLLQVTSVKNACCDFLSRCLHPANCLAIKHFADAHNCVDLERQALRYAVHHFEDLLGEEEFPQISFALLRDLLNHTQLDVSQGLLLQGILTWAAYDLQTRKDDLDSVLCQLSISQSSDIYRSLSEKIISNHDTRSNREMDVDKVPDNENQDLQDRIIDAKEVLLAVGGESAGLSLSSAECLLTGVSAWSQQLPLGSDDGTTSTRLADLNHGRSGMAIVATDTSIYVIGGLSSFQPLDSVECYNIGTNKWSQVSPLVTKRNGAGAALIADCVYVVGGCDSDTYHRTVELYDLHQNQWSPGPAMKMKRSFCEVVAVGGFIYAIGGSGGADDNACSPLSSVERYDSNMRKWASVAGMHKARSYLSSVVRDGKIYVAGGSDGEHVLNSVERYDPCTNQWTFLSRMKTARMGFCLVAFSAHLYAVGGFDGRANLNSVERYNIDKNNWEKTHAMLKRRYRLGVSVVRFTNKMLKTLNV